MSTFAPGIGRGRPPNRPVHAPLDHREVHAMNTQILVMQAVHADRLARLHAEAHRARLVRPVPAETRRLRRTIGRSLVRAGQLIVSAMKLKTVDR